ncbi:hypothetical protein CK203_042514 [Vitis vinifera]|uniref:Uncharacterized protein n=1 Tax=Vitis vinifera TaxID=29760 RepID=A0A438HF09_VITVI|nr:hypothetical protein CK203_042514 [Vitis vinifera]
MLFLFSFQGCCAKFWSTWGILLSLSWSANAFAESQLLGEHSHDIYLRVYLLLLLPFPEVHQLLQLHLSHPLQLNQGWPFPFLNTESYAVHWRPSQHLKSSLAHEMAAIRACQEQMLATQAQHTTAILRQLQHHFDLPPVAEPFTSTTAVPHSYPTEPQAPSEAATEEEIPLPPFNCNHSYHIEDNAQMLQMTLPWAYIGGGKLLETPGAIYTKPLVGRVWKVLEMPRDVHTSLHYGGRHGRSPRLSRDF